jgi:hypothetical protein
MAQLSIADETNKRPYNQILPVTIGNLTTRSKAGRDLDYSDQRGE